MAEDALWYEAANVVGITNALNVVADGLAPAHDAGLFASGDAAAVSREAAAVFGEIQAFYACGDVPLAFRLLAVDAGYLADVWAATRQAFTDARLPRRLKESLAFAVSLTTRSAFGTTFHLGEMRRLGVTERGVVEILGVAQMFSSYTKIADTLHLEPDMSNIAPVDRSPAPGAVPPGS